MKNNKGIQSQDFSGLINQEVLIITQAVQLNLLGQVFRPIFCGTISEVGVGHLTLTPVTVKMVNAPFYKFPTPISIPLEKIVSFSTEVPSDLVFPLT
ncbi:hypothetical protein CSV80_16425 [Sporosarcina sp. P12(2017)]|uniref:hypothetical protein n=1 Tax=unclassified Sporosarcina TaxID=2647733 RepID=UPI000C167FD6|nr:MULTISPECIES: hypothetical protein [unclassified Sporosarcina]PIC56029.1 hypothetical protein CSV81_16430 [Sporosarcina sp. P10]PIC59356.1 hypothetical protein CSV80_16425 [Sporosarcina sp. P12(2017)]